MAEAIARSIQVMTGLRTPIVTVITGEGGSGGALALAVGDVVLALENSIYSVISPEGAASILWRYPEFAQQAAVAMRLTAAEQLALGVIDEVVPEPAGGAHEHPEETAKQRSRRASRTHLDALAGRDRRRWSTRATRAIGGWASSRRTTERRAASRSGAGLCRAHPPAARRWPCRARRRRRCGAAATRRGRRVGRSPLREDV